MSDLTNDLLVQIHDQQVTMAQSIGRIEAKLDTKFEAVEARVGAIESAQVRHWWVTVAIAPFLTAIHAAARKLGVSI